MPTILTPHGSVRPACASFDWDGTVSLIRGGWRDLMVTLFQQTLPPGEPAADAAWTADTIDRLTGHPTERQMEALAAETRRRGGQAITSAALFEEYSGRLRAVIDARLAALAAGKLAPDDLMVPGARAFLEAVRSRGVTLCVASGTDQTAVRREAELLGLTALFAAGIHGAQADHPAHSKREMLAALGWRGPAFVGFGDGIVETALVSALGGHAVGIVCDESHPTQPDDRKRQVLIAAGARTLATNYLSQDRLLAAVGLG